MENHGTPFLLKSDTWDVVKGKVHVENKIITTVCKGAMRKIKAHLTLTLLRDTKNNNKGFYKYTSNKMKISEKGISAESDVCVMMTETQKGGINECFLCLSLYS